MAQVARKVARAAKTATTATTHHSPLTYTPSVSLKLGPTHNSRLRSHYESTLADDLMYLHYQHHDANYVPPFPPKKREHEGAADGSDPYARNRPPPRPKGNKTLKPLTTNVGGKVTAVEDSISTGSHTTSNSDVERNATPAVASSSSASPITASVGVKHTGGARIDRTITQLKSIQLHIMSKDAISTRALLIPAMFQLRALSGSSRGEGGHDTNKGIQLIYGRKNLPQWKLRRGVPCGAKVTLKGDKMYDFLGTFVEFVLPRLREWNGVVMPAPSVNRNSPSMVSGVVSIGLKHDAIELFPQIEVNQDLYPRLTGMYIHFFTNERGRGAQNKARALLSGFQIPFTRK
ncbi:hypothetical protein FRC18_004740 [Serendipita sp. 400]|nr:hypothetical protein FRC18_004740 [Serendipita sp. 400]